jgi:MerR family transcriptional regulator, repressor of the yfmOP operon
MSAAPRGELRIGDVAKLAATTTRTIRYYEEIGLLPVPAGREPGSHRTYAAADVERLRDLLRLKDLLGVTLEELKELVAVEGARAALRREWEEGVEDPVRRREILTESLAHISRQLQLVRRRRDEISKLESELLAKRERVRKLKSTPPQPSAPGSAC